jgi:hypothetical protein
MYIYSRGIDFASVFLRFNDWILAFFVFDCILTYDTPDADKQCRFNSCSRLTLCIYIYEPNMGINSEKDELYFYILLK